MIEQNHKKIIGKDIQDHQASVPTKSYCDHIHSVNTSCHGAPPFPGQPVPMLNHPSSEEIFPNIQPHIISNSSPSQGTF